MRWLRDVLGEARAAWRSRGLWWFASRFVARRDGWDFVVAGLLERAVDAPGVALRLAMVAAALMVAAESVT